MEIGVLSAIAFSVQGIAMFIDEFYFHMRRGLGRWERLGHPVDTLFFIAALWGGLNADRIGNAWAAGIAVLSSLVILKDEFEHKKLSSVGENVLHGVLFMIHPLVLIAVWFERVQLGNWVLVPPVVFLLYQVVYWGLLRKGKWPAEAGGLSGVTVERVSARPLSARGENPSTLPALESRALREVDAELINNAIYDDLAVGWKDSARSPFRLLKAEAEVKNRWVADQIACYRDAVGKRKLRVLDLGCGAGYLANFLSLDPDLEVVGLDASPGAIQTAKASDPMGRVKYVIGNAYELASELGEFDAIFVMDVLEHVSRPELVIREIAGRLTPGGLIGFHTFNRNFLANLIVIKGMEWFVPETPKKLHVIELFIRPKELSDALVTCGFHKVEFVGLRPVVFQRPLLKLLTRRRVDPNFRFKLTRDLTVAYMGTAQLR